MRIKKYYKLKTIKLNDPKFKPDPHADCWLNENQCFTCKSNRQNNQEIVDLHHRRVSLYIIFPDKEKRTKLFVYDTESNIEERKVLNTPKSLSPDTCIALLPNGELFCFGAFSKSGVTLIIDNNYKVRVLPSGISCKYSSAIYFHNSIYCFGGKENTGYHYLALSIKFDFNENRWINLTSMPEGDYHCHTVIFNGNILISSYKNRNLLLYSIDIDSFSTIPYAFAWDKRKILISAERLYLIECNGEIYESEARNVYVWKKISQSIISDHFPSYVYCLYNNGAIYIATDWYIYYKFDLSQKNMIVIE